MSVSVFLSLSLCLPVCVRVFLFLLRSLFYVVIVQIRVLLFFHANTHAIHHSLFPFNFRLISLAAAAHTHTLTVLGKIRKYGKFNKKIWLIWWSLVFVHVYIECLHQSNEFACHSAVNICSKSLSFRIFERFERDSSNFRSQQMMMREEGWGRKWASNSGFNKSAYIGFARWVPFIIPIMLLL